MLRIQRILILNTSFWLESVLTIHLILMRIRILDTHWKKMDPGPGHEHIFKIY